jgi:hypothetical protein
MINSSPKCTCGKDKAANTQWCSSCWDMLPEIKKHEYAHALQILHRVTNSAERALMSRKLDVSLATSIPVEFL